MLGRVPCTTLCSRLRKDDRLSVHSRCLTTRPTSRALIGRNDSPASAAAAAAAAHCCFWQSDVFRARRSRRATCVCMPRLQGDHTVDSAPPTANATKAMLEHHGEHHDVLFSIDWSAADPHSDPPFRTPWRDSASLLRGVRGSRRMCTRRVLLTGVSVSAGSGVPSAGAQVAATCARAHCHCATSLPPLSLTDAAFRQRLCASSLAVRQLKNGREKTTVDDRLREWRPSAAQSTIGVVVQLPHPQFTHTGHALSPSGPVLTKSTSCSVGG